MKLNFGVKQFSVLGNWMTNILISLVTIAVVWQGSFFLNTSAMAAPSLFMTTNTANQARGAADEIRDASKDLIQNTKQNVEKTASKNAAKVDRADGKGSIVERKAQRDQARIEKRAEQDAARTEKAVDDSMNTVKDVVENIKGAFSK